MIVELDEQLGDSDDDILLSYRLHGLLRVDEALSGLAARYGMTVDSAVAHPDLAERRAHVTAGHVRMRFPDE